MSATGILGAIAIAILLAISYADRYLPALSDWYLDLAALPGIRSTTTELFAREGGDPFVACARQAAMRDRSVGAGAMVTFAPEVESRKLWLSPVRVLILSMFDEEFEDGVTAVNEFCCVARLNEETWVVESVEVRRISPDGGAADLAGGADRP
jgi:hypothetical protein